MKIAQLKQASLLILFFLVACSNKQSPETVVKEYLELHRPGTWTAVVLDHEPFLDFRASAPDQKRFDLFLASRVPTSDDDPALLREALLEGMAFDFVLDYKIKSTHVLSPNKTEVVVQVTSPKPELVLRLLNLKGVRQLGSLDPSIRAW